MRRKCKKKSWKHLFTLFQLAVHHLLWQIKKMLTFLLNHPADRVSSSQGDTRDIPVTDIVWCCLERHPCEKLRSFPVVIPRPAAMANAKKGKEEKKEEAAMRPNLPKLWKLKWLKKANKEEADVRLNLAKVKSKPFAFWENVKTQPILGFRNDQNVLI